MSLGARIALGVAVVLMLTLVGLGAAMTRVTRATLTAEIDDRLVTSVERAARLPGQWDGDSGPRGRDGGGPPGDEMRTSPSCARMSQVATSRSSRDRGTGRRRTYWVHTGRRQRPHRGWPHTPYPRGRR